MNNVRVNIGSIVKMAAENILNDPSLDRDTKRSIILHITRPWVPGFTSMAIAPAAGRTDMDKWFSVPLFERGGRTWYFPSMHWFRIHARASHPPDGTGCNAAAHVSFLTKGGENYEFDYGSLMRDGRLHVLEPRDFELECWWWKKYF